MLVMKFFVHLLALGVISLILLDPSEAVHDEIFCVEAKPGKVCGASRTVLDKELVQWLGIPYALPPIGEHRFKPPKAMKKWEGVLDASKNGKSCLQDFSMRNLTKVFHDFQPEPDDTSEDCLFLNIVAPKGAKNLPVMLWIHGGGYIIGSGSLPVFDGAGMVAEANVVYVSINYRLGILGFGSLGSKTMPGNMGLLDQRLAMKWVHQNIANFGGDPSKVTIFGESAGGVSVSAHLAAPKSHKYFSSAIIESGTLYSNWAMMKPEVSKAKVHQLAAHLGCETTDDRDVEKCLKEKPGQDLTVSLGKSFFDFMGAPISPDPNFFGGDAFEQLASLDFKNKKILIGHTAEEAGAMVPLATNLKLPFHQEKKWEIDTKYLNSLAGTTFEGYDPRVIGQLLTEYRSLDRSNVFRFIRMLSEVMFDCPTLEFTHVLAKTNTENLYLYKYDHIPSKNDLDASLGSYHSSEVRLHMGLPLTEDGWSEQDKLFSREMIRIWTSLEKLGSPSVDGDWPPVASLENPQMKVLHAQHPKVITEHADARCKLIIEGRPNEKRYWKEEL